LFVLWPGLGTTTTTSALATLSLFPTHFSPAYFSSTHAATYAICFSFQLCQRDEVGVLGGGRVKWVVTGAGEEWDLRGWGLSLDEYV